MSIELQEARSLANHLGINIPELTPEYMDGIPRLLDLMSAAEKIEENDDK